MTSDDADSLTYSLRGAARRIGASLSHINRELRDRNLHGKKMGRRVLIHEAEIQRYIDALPDASYDEVGHAVTA